MAAHPRERAVGRSFAATRRQRVLLHAVAGGALGYVVLHPVAMSIFRSLDHAAAPALAAQGTGGSLHAMAESFHAHMLPMGLLFGLLCAAIGAMDGYLRAALAYQRDDLAKQLALNLEYRQELETTLAQVRELELTSRRATRFMVHDLKNHLACILGFSGQLRKPTAERAEPDARDAAERIHRQALRMLGAVTDLLDLARLGEAPSIAYAEVRPAALLVESAHDLSLPSRQGRIEVGAGAASCPPARADSRLLGRVLVNLAANAFKHNPAGTCVTLDAQALRSPDAMITFSCHDDGHGVPDDELPSIFQEFRTTDGGGASSGLGLAFCRAAVEAHGGRIWCDSVPGAGTTFYFTIPIWASAASATPVGRS